MNLATLTCRPGQRVGLNGLSNQATGVREHHLRGVPNNVNSTWSYRGAQLRALGSPLHLPRTTSRKTVHSRHLNESTKFFQPSSGTLWMPQGLGADFNLGSHQPCALSSEDVSLISRSTDSDDDQDQTVEESTGSSIEDSLSVSGEAPVAQSGGKAGFVSFYSPGSNPQEQPKKEIEELEPGSDGRKDWSTLLWLAGPLALVFSVVGPPLYLRRVFETVLEDSLLTDFVILFFTESLFYVGVSLFLFISHKLRVQHSPALAQAFGETIITPLKHPVGYRVSMIISLALGVVLPVVSFAVVWPWTGPAAAAALLPYLVGLGVQLVFEKVVRSKKSPVWPLVPITFQVYRLHQLNRAAQLVAGLLFSLKGVEATAETMAINGSLQSLLSVLQLLGILCLWSLGSFLMHHFPSWPQRDQTITVP